MLTVRLVPQAMSYPYLYKALERASVCNRAALLFLLNLLSVALFSIHASQETLFPPTHAPLLVTFVSTFSASDVYYQYQILT